MKLYEVFKFSCYKYAPEQFRASVFTGYTDGVPVFEPIEFKHHERCECGNACVGGNSEAVIAKLKRLMRKRRKQYSNMSYTYGFMHVGSAKTYSYVKEFRFYDSSSYKERLAAYRNVVEIMERDSWRISSHTSAQLDGMGRVIDGTVKEKFYAIDKDGLIRIRFVHGKKPYEI